MRPHRIQRSRAKGWRMPPGAIYVGRPTVWGNPARSDWFVGFATRASVVAWFRQYALERGSVWWQPLRGHDLACWCPLDQPCHADVLLELANR